MLYYCTLVPLSKLLSALLAILMYNQSTSPRCFVSLHFGLSHIVKISRGRIFCYPSPPISTVDNLNLRYKLGRTARRNQSSHRLVNRMYRNDHHPSSCAMGLYQVYGIAIYPSITMGAIRVLVKPYVSYLLAWQLDKKNI